MTEGKEENVSHHRVESENTCKHERAKKNWIATDHGPGMHGVVLGYKYHYECPDCGVFWEQWE